MYLLYRRLYTLGFIFVLLETMYHDLWKSPYSKATRVLNALWIVLEGARGHGGMAPILVSYKPRESRLYHLGRLIIACIGREHLRLF